MLSIFLRRGYSVCVFAADRKGIIRTLRGIFNFSPVLTAGRVEHGLFTHQGLDSFHLHQAEDEVLFILCTFLTPLWNMSSVVNPFKNDR